MTNNKVFLNPRSEQYNNIIEQVVCFTGKGSRVFGVEVLNDDVYLVTYADPAGNVEELKLLLG